MYMIKKIKIFVN